MWSYIPQGSKPVGSSGCTGTEGRVETIDPSSCGTLFGSLMSAITAHVHDLGAKGVSAQSGVDGVKAPNTKTTTEVYQHVNAAEIAEPLQGMSRKLVPKATRCDQAVARKEANY
jgi:hypothetical protein